MTVPEPEAKWLLAAAGIRVPAGRIAPSVAKAEAAAVGLRAPLVLKAFGPGLLHKSDVGGVRIGLDHATVGPAAAEMDATLRAAGVTPLGFLVEEQEPPGVELIVGVAGPVVLLGLGGTLAEVLDQAVARLHPIDEAQAWEMLGAMPGRAVLDGVRGAPPVDRAAIVSVLLAVAGEQGLVARLGDEAVQFEINPLIATARGAVAVDARLVPPAVRSGSPSLPPPACTSFDRLFAPRTIGVIGASTSKLAFGNRFLRAYTRRGWRQGLYAVHPSAAVVEGVEAVRSVGDIRGGLDYLLVAVPAAACPAVVRSLAGQVGFAQVMSGGFAEAGAEGAALEGELLAAAREAGVRVVGPNCMGVYCPKGRQTWQLRDPTEPGTVSVVSQSGSLAGDIIKAGEARGLRLAKLVTVGNAIDVTPAELVEYFVADDDTAVIGLYLEGAPGPGLIAALRTAQGRKPVVALVGGLSRQGSRAAASHTGGMAGDARVWEAIGRSLNVAVVRTLEELIGALTYLQRYGSTPGGGALVVGPGGGASILAADAGDRAGVALEPVGAATQRHLRSLGYGEGTSVANPIEIGIGPAAPADAFDPLLGPILAVQPYADLAPRQRAVVLQPGGRGRGASDRDDRARRGHGVAVPRGVRRAQHRVRATRRRGRDQAGRARRRCAVVHVVRRRHGGGARRPDVPVTGLRDRAAIVGIGSTEYSKNSGVSTLTLALRAIASALADAGLTTHDVDGVACHRVGDSAQAVLVAHSLGIQDLRFHYDLFGGGSASAGVLGGAAMAVATGLARCVVCWRAINARSEFRMGGTGRAAPDTPEYQYLVPYGHVTPPQHFAMFARAYMARYGVVAEDLGRVAVQQRRHAMSNPRAMMRTPLTMDEYLASRWIVEPFRLFDCCLETDAAVALVVTTAERARDMAQVPVLISGVAYGSGHTLLSNHRGDWSTTAAAPMSRRLYEMAGVGPGDIDVAELYDAFTPLVLLQLEDYGFCAKGDGAALVAGGATALGGRLPVNTHGGHLSEGYVHGLNHAVEAVSQLRWACGDRQVPGAEVALSTGQPGYVAGSTSAVVLRRGA